METDVFVLRLSRTLSRPRLDTLLITRDQNICENLLTGLELNRVKAERGAWKSLEIGVDLTTFSGNFT